jgi:NDP-sugar pyrophosphorylase family protein
MARLPPALILAAGLGTRLDPLTRLVAKPAVPLGDRSLIERVLGTLQRQGVDEVVVNLHHLPASITGILGDGRHLGLTVRYSWEMPVLGSAGGPRRALPLLDAETFLILNGDTLIDVDLQAMLDEHRASGADVTMALVPNPAPDHYNGVVVDDERVVTGFRPRGQAEGTWHFVGIQVAHARVFSALRDGEPRETVADIYRQMIREQPGRIRGFLLDVPFIDVGTPRDYLDAALQFATPASGAQATPPTPHNGNITRSVIWAGARVGSRVTLDSCIVAGAVELPAGFAARETVVVPEHVVRAGDDVPLQDGLALFPLRR